MKKIIVFILAFIIMPVGIVYANESVYIGGGSIGISANYEGLYISGTYPFDSSNGKIDPSNNLRIKDLIIKVNHNNITSLNSFQSAIDEYREEYNEIAITIIRDNKEMESTLLTTFKNNQAVCGLYLKEKVLGVGTLTFYNPETQIYGALGHPITNEGNDYLQDGEIYDSSITSITPSTNEVAGNKNGNINYNEKIGDITKNNEMGIYGKYLETINSEKLEIADEEELHLGEAYFYTVIENENVEKFSIQITNIQNDLSQQKGIEFKVTDKDLLNRCGGIIHGMSGSPIVQDGKIIAAVTHVINEDPTMGYAIYIETMYQNSKN